jgi:basic membrane protein A and related proteins
MTFKRKILLVHLMIVFTFTLSACAGQATPAPETQPQTVPSEESISSTAKQPTELRIGAVFGATIDEAWYKAFVQSFERVKAEKPHGLTLSLDYTENVWGEDAERALMEYARSGRYDILWATSSYSDQVKNLKDKYPNILFAFTGSGNSGLGGNAYWTYNHVHEAAYLLGVIAGEMTKTNVIGAVAGFPYDDVNDVLNAYIDGAKSVNPQVKAKITFIESWYDPPKAKEATYALIAAGADYIYAERQGPFEAVSEKGVFAFGQYEDQNPVSPDVVVSSTILKWDPQFYFLIDEWWNNKTEGTPFNAPMEPIWFPMSEGAADIAPFHSFQNTLPPELLSKVEQIKADIISGKTKVELKIEPPKSD